MEEVTHAPRSASARPRGIDTRIPLAVLVGVPLAITIAGIHYYIAPLGERVRSPLHAWLRPAGTVGLWLGAVAFVLFLFLWLYPLRKQARWLAWTGAVGAWLKLHIVAGIAIPVLAAVHAGWRFDGLIGLGYLSMLLVALSGVVGRYLYTRIPRSRNGLELSRDEAAAERRTLVTEIAAVTREDPRDLERLLTLDASPGAASARGLVGSFRRLVADDRARARAVQALQRRWQGRARGADGLDPGAVARAIRLARRELALSQQVAMLEATHRLFALWHVVHRPFALLALLAVAVHVVVAVVIGGVRFF